MLLSAPDQAADADVKSRRLSKLSAVLLSGFIFTAAINGLFLCMPLYSLQIFGRAIPSSNRDTVIMLTIIVVLALTVMMLLEIVRTHILVRAGNLLEVAFRQRLLADAFAGSRHVRPSTGVMNDLSEVRLFLTRPMLTALVDLPWTPLYLVGIYLIHPALAGIMMVGTVLLVGIACVGHFVTDGLNERARIAGSRSGRLLDALMSRFETIRALRMLDAVTGHWAVGSLASAALTSDATERGGIFSSLAKWVRLLMQIAVTGVGAALVMDDQLSLGGMIATSLLVGRGMAPIEQLTAGWSGVIRSFKAFVRLRPHLHRTPRALVPVGTVPRDARLTVDNAVFMVSDLPTPILKPISFAMAPGELLCVFGPNRCGKSTLAKLLAGAIRPTAGSIRLGAWETHAWRPDDPFVTIGYLPQQIDLLPGTIGQNIARFMTGVPEAVIEAARWVGIHETIQSLPNGYDTDVVHARAMLAGGTERLIGLARAAFGRPALLILDEPLAYLDIAGCEMVRSFVSSAKARGIMTVVLSQQSALVDLADKVMVVVGGAMVTYGPRDQVVAPLPRKVRPVPAEAAIGDDQSASRPHVQPLANPAR